MTLNSIPELHAPPLPGPAAGNGSTAASTTPPLLPPSGAEAAPSPASPAPMPAPAAPVFLSPAQLAVALGVSRRTLTTWNQRRIIPSVCVGRVRRYELEGVRQALRAHGQPCSSSSSSCAAPSIEGGDHGATATY
ncbi:helix-turn-helix domain-containing protein [Prosthecobacter sp.]|uniref:helix-turn-helix domain-containing protein n=1 Tax=Prosthecobacter sp. TaxID=1965333 RepID=UPI0037840957